MLGSRGFTLIELLITLVVVGLLLTLGMPMINETVDNNRLKAAATSFSSGLQYARSQAIARNAPIRLVPVMNGANLTAGWQVLDAANAQIQGKDRFESAADRVNVAANAAFVGVSFNGLGAATFIDAANATVAGINPGIYRFTSQNAACAPAGPIRCLDVRVAAGGQIRMCDPAVAAGDSRAC